MYRWCLNITFSHSHATDEVDLACVFAAFSGIVKAVLSTNAKARAAFVSVASAYLLW